MRKILTWLDNNFLAAIAGFLLVFIPLYPKWPLFDILPGYIVRVRLEDFLVAFTLALFGVQVLRRKFALANSPVSIGLGAYLLFGFLSMIVAVFVIQTVPLQLIQVGKTFLHWLRRIEYFSLFFVLFGSIKSAKSIRIYLTLFFLTFVAVIIYGYGQKYLYWPAFSTMNREFAKGWWLYLTEHARVLSTFGGHYDLAAYLVISLTLSWSFFFGTTKKLAKLFFGLLLATGFWLLILTASRSSFIGYLAGLSVVVFFWTFRKGPVWGISRWFVAVSLSIILMLSFGDLSDRFLHLIRASERIGALRQVLLTPALRRPQNQAAFLENNIAAVTSASDMPPTPGRPSDVTGSVAPLLFPEKTASGSTILVEKPRTYSQNALLFDLSTGIRLDATWPLAIKGFTTDPILGSGYATLNKTSKYEFTEAESTDNDYLRSLGETGLLGFIAYFGAIVLMMAIAIRSLGGLRDNSIFALSAGFIGLTIGLLLNALLLDIFEASKVAYMFWGVAGLTMGTLYFLRKKISQDYQPLRLVIPWHTAFANLRKFLFSDLFWVSVIASLTIFLRSYKFDAPVADWHSWRQADTSAVTRNFIKKQQIDWLYPTYEDLSSIASGKPNPAGFRFVEFPIYNAAAVVVHDIVPEFNVEESGRATTILFSVLSMVFIFLICRRLFSRRVAYLSAFTFSALPDSIYYGRTILPDPTMAGTSLGAIWFAIRFLDTKKARHFILSLIFAAIALLVKPFAIFLLLPILYLWLVTFGVSVRFLVLSTSFFLLASIPVLAWRWWIGHFPEGVPASDWLYNGNGIRFKGAFWYWLFADRIGRLILGFWALIPLGFGLVRKLDSKYRFFAIFLFFSSLLYLAVFATGNVQHDYYQILLIPSLSILVGLGLDFLLFHAGAVMNNYLAKFLAVVSILFAFGFGWYFVRDYFNINHPEIVAAGQKLNQLADGHEKALVIAPYDGDTAFLYQTKRNGWPIVEKPIDDMIKMGADYYVSVKFDDLTKQLLADSQTKDYRRTHPLAPPKKYTLLAYTDSYVIIQLVPDGELPGN